MEIAWELRGTDTRVSSLARLGKDGRPLQVVRPILTVQEVCRRLHRSRRQIYRYLRAGRLKACARILGQWLFSEEEIRLFQSGRLPEFLRPFFWDVRVADLSPKNHQEFILGRLLESGDRQAVDWTLKIYSREALLSFLRGRGEAVLSKRARNFWILLLGAGVRRPGREAWRRRGRSWGGAS